MKMYPMRSPTDAANTSVYARTAHRNIFLDKPYMKTPMTHSWDIHIYFVNAYIYDYNVDICKSQ